MRYAIGEHGNGERYELRDPRAAEIEALIADVPRTGPAISAALFTLPGLFPKTLTEHRAWAQDVSDKLEILIQDDRLPLF
ncbi:mannitol dehydrogenase family protein, partial [Rhizobium phaseoli]